MRSEKACAAVCTSRAAAVVLAFGLLLTTGCASRNLAGPEASGGPATSTSSSMPPMPEDAVLVRAPNRSGKTDKSWVRQQRANWQDTLNRAAPGIDWRARNAELRAERRERVSRERGQLVAAGASPSDLARVSSRATPGAWVERGSSNQAGRTAAVHLDVGSGQLSLLSAGGNLWRANYAGLEWTVPSDVDTFLPYGAAGYFERLSGPPSERLLVASDQPNGLFYSDNGGISFVQATGVTFPDYASYAHGLAARSETGAEVYLIRNGYDPDAQTERVFLFASANRGASWTLVDSVGPRNQTAIFSPRYDSNEVFLLAGDELSVVTPGTHAVTPVGTITMSEPIGADDHVALSGGVDSETGTFLFAFVSRVHVGRTDVFRSLDGGETWDERTPVPVGLFDNLSVESSTRDPEKVYAGGYNMYRSHDGGDSWQLVNEWHAYDLDADKNLHADITNVDVFVDGEGDERVFVSTDGGLYESLDHLVTVDNLSLDSLRVSQYYDVLTARTAPFMIMVGSQDQGFQIAAAPGAGVAPFEQGLAGDWGNLVSGDGGETLWMASPGSVELDLDPQGLSYVTLREWIYGTQGFESPHWLAPLAVVPDDPLRAIVAGGHLGSGGHRLVELDYDGAQIVETEGSYNFGDPITALAFSPHGAEPLYVLATPGAGGSRFYKGTFGGSWSHTASELQNHQYFYASSLVPDPVVAGRVYVAGSGYANPAVFVSTDEGVTFAAMSTGLPSTGVTALAISPNGRHLFAATEVGPYYFDRATQTWQDIAGLGAPNQRYTDVEFVAELGLARFTTFGRGVWDFVLDEIFADGFETGDDSFWSPIP